MICLHGFKCTERVLNLILSGFFLNRSLFIFCKIRSKFRQHFLCLFCCRNLDFIHFFRFSCRFGYRFSPDFCCRFSFLHRFFLRLVIILIQLDVIKTIQHTVKIHLVGLPCCTCCAFFSCKVAIGLILG